MNTQPTSSDRAARFLGGSGITLLPPGPAMRLDPRWIRSASGQRLMLEVSAGALWLTWPGCDDDRYLVAGERCRLPDDPDVLRALLIETEPRLAPGAAQFRVVGQPAPGIDCASSCQTRSLLQFVAPLLRR